MNRDLRPSPCGGGVVPERIERVRQLLEAALRTIGVPWSVALTPGRAHNIYQVTTHGDEFGVEVLSHGVGPFGLTAEYKPWKKAEGSNADVLYLPNEGCWFSVRHAVKAVVMAVVEKLCLGLYEEHARAEERDYENESLIREAGRLNTAIYEAIATDGKCVQRYVSLRYVNDVALRQEFEGMSVGEERVVGATLLRYGFARNSSFPLSAAVGG